jgi:hypothetical protein
LAGCSKARAAARRPNGHAEAERQRAEAERRRADDQRQASRRLRRWAVYLSAALVFALGMTVLAALFGEQARQSVLSELSVVAVYDNWHAQGAGHDG